ncbi:hypothetical protein ABK040_003685 [Willaertia magna]
MSESRQPASLGGNNNSIPYHQAISGTSSMNISTASNSSNSNNSSNYSSPSTPFNESMISMEQHKLPEVGTLQTTNFTNLPTVSHHTMPVVVNHQSIPPSDNTSITCPSPTINTSSNFAQIACTNCRARHKKCSRELPSCYYCKKMGKECVYLKSRKGQDQKDKKKRKRNGSCSPTDTMSTAPTITSNMVPQTNIPPVSVPTNLSVITSGLPNNPCLMGGNTPTSSIPTSSTPVISHPPMMPFNVLEIPDPTNYGMVLSNYVHSPNFRYTAHTLLDLYYKELCAGFALVEKGVLDSLIDLLMGHDNTNVLNGQLQLDSLTFDSLVSTLYSILALALQQSGDYVLKGESRKKVMEFLHSSSKESISKHFDNMDNIYVAVALYYVCQFLCGEGDFRKTSLYLAMVKQMIGLHGYGGPNDQQVGSVGACYAHQQDINPSLPKFLLRILVRYTDTFLSDYTAKLYNSESKVRIGVFGSRLKLDTSFISNEKGSIESLYLPLIEHVVQIAQTYYGLLFETMYNSKEGDIFNIILYIFTQEFFLDLYRRVESISPLTLLHYANEIIAHTKTEKYIFTPYLIANGVAKAVSIRLQYWRQSTTPIDFKDDLRALRALSSRYGVVQKLYGDLINQIENAILLQQMGGGNSLFGLGGMIDNGANNNTSNQPTSTTINIPPNGLVSSIIQTDCQSTPQSTSSASSTHGTSPSSPTQSIVPPHQNTTATDFTDEIFEDPFSSGNANLLSMLFSEVGNEKSETLNEDSFLLDSTQFNEMTKQPVQSEKDNPFVKGFHVVKMMIKQLSKLKEALHMTDQKTKEESLKKGKHELIEELIKALPNDAEAKFILELTKHQHPQQIHPCQYSHIALLFE